VATGNMNKRGRGVGPSSLRTVDLFSGCGGLSLGFQNAGFNIVAAFENWQLAADNYRLNFPHPVFLRDLKTTSDLSDIAKFNPQLILGGPPCQDFSGAGHRDESLGRADLTVSFMEIVATIRPDYFLMENVPRIKTSPILQKINNKLLELGYGLTQTILDASLCGVPQKRKRYFLIGELGGNEDFLKERLISGLSKDPMTVFDYLGNSLGMEYYFRVPRSYTRRGIFSIHEPAMTVRGVDRPVPKGYPNHSADPIPMNSSIRTLTYKERSLIQTFPADFVFQGAKTNLNQLIGNAVPVKLAEYIATALRGHIEEK
jgi:DNA (cytosine-5)-methyltransferase 1